MIKKIGIVALVLIAGVLAYAATRSDTFSVARSISIKAPAEKIYPYMSDFHKGALWNPYEKRDPAMKRTYSGAASGKGAVCEFEGNKDVGKGRLEIIDAVPPAHVVLTLDMLSPMKGHNIVEYALEPKGDSTNVTWSMRGKCNYFAKVLGIFINIDTMVGRDFEAGLENLKALTEKS